MPDIIKLLPDSIANQIAAGEVVQRPASAVKELLENAVDAGANSIQLIIKDAGKTLIQVIDNGCGMSETDARMCFERHATSKIREAEDLFNIRTMGFRGEAMASIAAIAQVELKSRRPEDEIGTLLYIEGSEVKYQEPCQTQAGTSIAVKNLFYNTPARRNFLKSNTVETRHIIDEFQRVALAYPNIHFTLHHNGMELFHLQAGNLRKRIVQIFGNNYNERLVPVEESTTVASMAGFVGKPDCAKKTRGEQYFFVNSRFIKSPYLNHAILNAFEDLIPSNSHALYVLFLDVDPQRIDVNVHPTKQEVKFQDEKIIYAYLHSAVKRALGKYSVTPTLDFDQETSFGNFDLPKQPVYIEREGSQQPSNFRPTFDPGKKKQPWEDLFHTGPVPGEQSITIRSSWPAENMQEDIEADAFEEHETKPYQLHHQYIVSPIKSGLIIIDQQAAHERVLYERFLNILNAGKVPGQKQLFPQTVQLNTADAEVMRQILPEINALGFDIQEFGKNDFVVHGIPADVQGLNEQEVIEGLIEQYKVNAHALHLEKRDNLARAMAQQTAIKRGKQLSSKEMRVLIDELFACKDFMTAPTGSLTFIRYTLQDLERQFEKKNMLS